MAIFGINSLNFWGVRGASGTVAAEAFGEDIL